MAQKEVVYESGYSISENNRLTYVYKTDRRGAITEVTCVSLEIKVKNMWKTIIYYDSSHRDNLLHRHTFMTLESDSDVTDYKGVKRKGTQKELLEWSIHNITSNYIFYKKRFIKLIRRTDKLIDIEFF